MDKTKIYSLIGKALADELSEVEKIIFEEMMKNTAFKEEYETSKIIWESPSAPSKKAVVAGSQWRTNLKPNKVKKVAFYKYWQKSIGAAAVLIIAFFGVNFYQNNILQEEWVTLETGIGEQKEIIISDGSKVLLNAQSTLKYPLKFKGENRNVSLIGEAFFEVSKDKEHPFVIETATIDVTVLGTSFNISSYSNDHENSVALITGKVKLKSKLKKEEKTLSPGQTYLLNKEAQTSSVINERENQRLAWLKKEVSFNYATLQEVINALQRLYPVTIKVKNKALFQERITSKFNQNTPLKEVLTLLEVMLGCEIEQNNQLIFLK